MRFHALIVTAIAMAQLAFGEHLGRRCVDLVGDVAVAEVGDRLGERQRGSLAFGEQVAGLFPRVQQREALLGLAALGASWVCMSRQNAQWFICEARIFIRSARAGSMSLDAAVLSTIIEISNASIRRRCC